MTLFLLLLFLLYNSFSRLSSANLLPIVLETNYDTNYTFSINSSIEYIFLFNKTDFLNPSRVSVTCNAANSEYPLLVVIRQQKEVLSWQVPLFVTTRFGDLQYSDTSRTLCPDNLNSVAASPHDATTSPIVSMSTSAPYNINFTLKIDSECEFFLSEAKEYTSVVSASSPKVFYYQFTDRNGNGTAKADSDTVLLKIDSDSEVCMLVSIQNSSCPVYDLEHDVRFEGFWETVNKKGAMTIPRSKFPHGFFVVFVSKGDDYECTGKSSTAGVIHREKPITFSISASISYEDYVNAVVATLAASLVFYVLFYTLLCFCSRKSFRPMTMDSIDVTNDDETAEAQERDACTPATPCSDITAFPADPDPYFDDDCSMDETEYDTITEVDLQRDIIRTKRVLFLNDLARKDPRILKNKSYLYLWHVLTVAVFYGLPVVQLVVTYQKVLSETGNQDLCYYNFRCAHPLGILSDFNHVFSNIGYVALGILFLLLIWRRERMHKDSLFDRHYGIPQHYGLFYAMGVALIMEGVLSGSYHVCPNHSNFQFDSSFMYVMAVLCMVKIYQNRHPDINATAYATFGVLAVAICLGMVGILEGSTTVFWAGFTVLHLLTCLLLTVQIYYLGCWKFDRGIIMRIFRTLVNDFRSGPVNVLRPVYKGRMILLLLGNAANWALAVLGLYNHDRDFATYLLAIFMSNTLLYTLFYIVMKLCHRERIEAQAVLFIVLATVAWAAAMYFFIHKSISWALTPAESRRYNQPCQLLQFYDPHDIWHFLSASAMFFSFMILLTLDDDLSHTHRSRIHVF